MTSRVAAWSGLLVLGVHNSTCSGDATLRRCRAARPTGRDARRATDDSLYKWGDLGGDGGDGWAQLTRRTASVYVDGGFLEEEKMTRASAAII